MEKFNCITEVDKLPKSWVILWIPCEKHPNPNKNHFTLMLKCFRFFWKITFRNQIKKKCRKIEPHADFLWVIYPNSRRKISYILGKLLNRAISTLYFLTFWKFGTSFWELANNSWTNYQFSSEKSFVLRVLEIFLTML